MMRAACRLVRLSLKSLVSIAAKLFDISSEPTFAEVGFRILGGSVCIGTSPVLPKIREPKHCHGFEW